MKYIYGKHERHSFVFLYLENLPDFLYQESNKTLQYKIYPPRDISMPVMQQIYNFNKQRPWVVARTLIYDKEKREQGQSMARTRKKYYL